MPVAAPASAQTSDGQSSSVTAPAPVVARPPLLPPLYVSFAVLQGLDVASTRAAMRNPNVRDWNPLIDVMRDSPPALIAFKAATTAAVVLATERVRKHHPKSAVALMIGLNSVYAVVVAHNYALAGRR